MPAPTLAEVKVYLRETGTSRDVEIASALAAEGAAQALRCRLPATRSFVVSRVAGTPQITALDGAQFFPADVGATATVLNGFPAGSRVAALVGTGPVYTQALMSSNASANSSGTAITLTPEWPETLTEALLRRVAYNLAMRPLPLGVSVSVAESFVSTRRVGGLDAEVKRLEAPHRKYSVG